MQKRNYDMVINIIKNVNDNDELLDIVININDLEFLNYFANYIESLISKTTDYEEKLKLELLIRRFNLPYRILYLEGGCVAAEGSHHELLKKCKEYKTLYESELIND